MKTVFILGKKKEEIIKAKEEIMNSRKELDDEIKERKVYKKICKKK